MDFESPAASNGLLASAERNIPFSRTVVLSVSSDSYGPRMLSLRQFQLFKAEFIAWSQKRLNRECRRETIKSEKLQ